MIVQNKNHGSTGRSAHLLEFVENDQCAAKEMDYLLKLWNHLKFSSSEQFSMNLQAKDTSIQDAMYRAELVIPHYQSLRSEAKFGIIHAL